jgi:hypothetical protein
MMDEELTAHAEKSDGYHGVIIRLNALWRVVGLRCGHPVGAGRRTGCSKKPGQLFERYKKAPISAALLYRSCVPPDEARRRSNQAA